MQLDFLDSVEREDKQDWKELYGGKVNYRKVRFDFLGYIYYCQNMKLLSLVP